GIEPLDCVIAGGMPGDFGRLLARNYARYRGSDDGLADTLRGATARAVTTVVRPETFEPLVPRHARAVYAGISDRFSTPWDAVRVWRHWDNPESLWLQHGHIGTMMSPRSHRFV